MPEIYEWLNVAEDLAPTPTEPEAPREDWARHFAALALAAHAAFRDQLPRIPTGPREPGRGSMPELGYLMHIASGAKAAAVALLTPADEVSALIWDLTPEQGSLNGEDVDWLADTVAKLGINPAHLYPWYAEADFAEVVAAATPAEPVKGRVDAWNASVTWAAVLTISGGHVVDLEAAMDPYASNVKVQVVRRSAAPTRAMPGVLPFMRSDADVAHEFEDFDGEDDIKLRLAYAQAMADGLNAAEVSK